MYLMGKVRERTVGWDEALCTLPLHLIRHCKDDIIQANISQGRGIVELSTVVQAKVNVDFIFSLFKTRCV
jgi:hypothetical protein